MCMLKLMMDLVIDILVKDMRDIKFDLGVSTGVDLCPAVGRHVAQDLWHLPEHRQTPHVDLRAESNNKLSKCLTELWQALHEKTEMCVCVTCVLNSSPRLVNRYSYPYAALQLSHTT